MGLDCMGELYTWRQACPPSPEAPCFSELLLRGVGGGPMLYLSFISLVTLLVMRPHSRPPKKSTHTPTMMTDKM